MNSRKLALNIGLAASCILLCSEMRAQTLERSTCIEAERAVYTARQAEKRGDVMSAAQSYTTAISYLQSSAPPEIDMSKVILCGEPVKNIGRRMIYYQLKLLHQELAKAQPTMSTEVLLKDLRAAYSKMGAIESKNPTWPYLEAVASAADGDYRQAFIKCRESAMSTGGDESVRQKARSLAVHIKPGALAQEKMSQEDKAAYEEYVRSGAQALDFAIVSARCSADEAKNRGDFATSDMWERRYGELRKQREQIKIR